MAIVGVNPWTDKWYTPWLQRLLKDGRARFKLRYPDRKTSAQAENESVKSSQVGFRTQTQFFGGTQKYELVKRCLKDWEGVLSDSGEPILFDASTPQALEHSLDVIPADTFDELYYELTKNVRGLRPIIEEAQYQAREQGVEIDEAA